MNIYDEPSHWNEMPLWFWFTVSGACFLALLALNYFEDR